MLPSPSVYVFYEYVFQVMRTEEKRRRHAFASCIGLQKTPVFFVRRPGEISRHISTDAIPKAYSAPLPEPTEIFYFYENPSCTTYRWHACIANRKIIFYKSTTEYVMPQHVFLENHAFAGAANSMRSTRLVFISISVLDPTKNRSGKHKGNDVIPACCIIEVYNSCT